MPYKENEISILYKTDHMKFNVIQCPDCGLAWIHPFPTDEILGTHDMDLYYGNNVNKFIPAIQNIRNRLMKIRVEYYLLLIPSSVINPRILDIGCAEGRFLNVFREYECQSRGVEHPDYPSERFIYNDQISYFQGDLESNDLNEESFDLIFLWHVLEHMDNPNTVFKRIYRLLATNGSVVLAVLYFSSLEANAFKQFWFHLDIPWHKFHFKVFSIL